MTTQYADAICEVCNEREVMGGNGMPDSCRQCYLTFMETATLADFDGDQDVAQDALELEAQLLGNDEPPPFGECGVHRITHGELRCPKCTADEHDYEHGPGVECAACRQVTT